MTASQSGVSPIVSIVIPAYNDWPLLHRCLKSIEHHTGIGEVETVVVVNGSTDGTYGHVLTSHPWVRLIVSEERLSIAAALNRGIAIATGDMVLIFETDAELSAGCLEHLVVVLQLNPRAAAVAPRRCYPDGTSQHTVQPFPSLRTECILGLRLGRLLRTRRSCQEPSRATAVVGALPAGGLLLDAGALRSVGGFDERYRRAYHDLDLCMTLHDAGRELWYTPNALVIHDIASELKPEVGRKRQDVLADAITYFQKQQGLVVAILVLAINFVGIVPAILAAVVRSRSRGGLRHSVRAALINEGSLLTPRGARLAFDLVRRPRRPHTPIGGDARFS